MFSGLFVPIFGHNGAIFAAFPPFLFSKIIGNYVTSNKFHYINYHIKYGNPLWVYTFLSIESGDVCKNPGQRRGNPSISSRAILLTPFDVNISFKGEVSVLIFSHMPFLIGPALHVGLWTFVFVPLYCLQAVHRQSPI